jgi:hypothetical protein
MTVPAFVPSLEQKQVIALRGGHLQVSACAGAGPGRSPAGCLRVSPNTLRNWDRGGKILAHRHPVNRSACSGGMI